MPKPLADLPVLTDTKILPYLRFGDDATDVALHVTLEGRNANKVTGLRRGGCCVFHLAAKFGKVRGRYSGPRTGIPAGDASRELAYAAEETTRTMTLVRQLETASQKTSNEVPDGWLANRKLFGSFRLPVAREEAEFAARKRVRKAAVDITHKHRTAFQRSWQVNLNKTRTGL